MAGRFTKIAGLAAGSFLAVQVFSGHHVIPGLPHLGGSHLSVPHGSNIWLAAERWQETCSPSGVYTEDVTGCLGAYCWLDQGVWDSAARSTGYGQYAGTPPYQVPPSVQDAVAWGVMGPYVTKGELAQAAEMWNGGVPYPVPNPVLGSSGVYAQQVIAKYHSLGGT